MLVLSRKINESIVIDGRITVHVLRLEGEAVKLGVTAPLEIPVLRKEIYDEIQSSNREAVGVSRAVLKRVLGSKIPALKAPERRTAPGWSPSAPPGQKQAE